jgi:3-hydroxyisobutyrate dehydrogenase
MAERIGIVGCGRLGTAVAGRLLECGFPVTVWNRTPSKTTPLARAGAAIARDPADLAARVPVIVLCLPGHAWNAVRDGREGLLAGAKPGSLALGCGDAEPTVVRAWVAPWSAAGQTWCDAAVVGNAEGIARGQAAVLAGGEPAALQRARAVLDALGSPVLIMGGNGSGHAARSATLAVTAAAVQAWNGALGQARGLGLDPAALAAALAASPAGRLAEAMTRPERIRLAIGGTVSLADKPFGLADKPSGMADRPSGSEDRPSGLADRPSGLLPVLPGPGHPSAPTTSNQPDPVPEVLPFPLPPLPETPALPAVAAQPGTGRWRPGAAVAPAPAALPDWHRRPASSPQRRAAAESGHGTADSRRNDNPPPIPEHTPASPSLPVLPEPSRTTGAEPTRKAPSEPAPAEPASPFAYDEHALQPPPPAPPQHVAADDLPLNGPTPINWEKVGATWTKRRKQHVAMVAGVAGGLPAMLGIGAGQYLMAMVVAVCGTAAILLVARYRLGHLGAASLYAIGCTAAFLACGGFAAAALGVCIATALLGMVFGFWVDDMA